MQWQVTEHYISNEGDSFCSYVRQQILLNLNVCGLGAAAIAWSGVRGGAAQPAKEDKDFSCAWWCGPEQPAA